MLTGELTKPQGGGPFAAVVLLHGCSGLCYWQILIRQLYQEVYENEHHQ
jgi:dienelactone hydrolase